MLENNQEIWKLNPVPNLNENVRNSLRKENFIEKKMLSMSSKNLTLFWMLPWRNFLITTSVILSDLAPPWTQDVNWTCLSLRCLIYVQFMPFYQRIWRPKIVIIFNMIVFMKKAPPLCFSLEFFSVSGSGGGRDWGWHILLLLLIITFRICYSIEHVSFFWKIGIEFVWI